MNTKVILGTSLAVLFTVSMLSAAYAINAGQFDIVSAATDGDTLTMTVAEKIKQIPAKDADDLITFYGWVTEIPSGGLVADVVAIHHGVNDHQAFGKDAQSSPVQSYHPHKVTFDAINCVIGLESPKSDFRVQHNTVTLESDDSFDFAATGTVGPRDECTATGLGITTLYDTE